MLVYCAYCLKSSVYSTEKKKCLECKIPFQYKCGKCLKGYSQLNSLRSHLYACMNLSEFHCDQCDYKNHSKGNLINHIKVKHAPRDNKSFVCKECGKNFWRSSLLRIHSNRCGKRRKILPDRFFCDQCEFKSYYKPVLLKHIQAKHLPRDNSLNKCTKCKKSFSSKQNLIKHSKICGLSPALLSNHGALFCDHCEYKTHHKSVLITHVHGHLPRNHQNSLNECRKCKKQFSTQATLKEHLKNCTESFKECKSRLFKKRFSCNLCDYRSKYKSNLVNHNQTIHLPRNPNLNKCKKCGKNFSNKGHLNRHLKICGQTEEFKRSLMRFSCDHCELKTDSKFHLKDHIHSKHMPRDSNTNKCKKCGKTYASLMSFNCHKKICKLK